MKYVIISWCKLGRRNSDPWWKIKVPTFLLAFLPWRRQPGKVLAKTWEAGEQNLCWISQGEDEGELVEGTELQGQEAESGLSLQQWCWAPSWAETLWPRTKPQWMRSDLEVDGWYQEGKRKEMQGSSQCPSPSGWRHMPVSGDDHEKPGASCFLSWMGQAPGESGALPGFHQGKRREH